MVSDHVRPSQRKGDILAALFWALLASVRLGVVLREPSLLEFGQLLFTLTVPLLFILRRPARAKGPWYTFWLALIGTFFAVAVLRRAEAGWRLPGEVIQIVGLAIILVSIWTLNRSFGMAPAHRGLVMHGPYSVVRHPLYAGEILAMAGYCVGYSSILNWVGLAVTIVAQVMRLLLEEQLLSQDEEYRAYQQRVRWRLLPGVW